jgi:hypothetical protein
MFGNLILNKKIMKILNKNEQKNITGGRKPSPRDCDRCFAYCALQGADEAGCRSGVCFGCEDY